MKDLKKRTISGAIGLLILIGLILKGGYTLGISILILSLIGIRELYNAMKNIDIQPIYSVGYLFSILIFLNTMLDNQYTDFLFATFIVISLLTLVFKVDCKIQDVSVTILGALYVPYLLFHIYYLDGTNYIWLIFIIAFASDTFAYLGGNLFGKTKLIPRISPNKTVEGSLSGIVGSVILTYIFTKVFSLDDVFKLLILAVIGAILSQVGDLIASRMKRLTGIKDFGDLIPGHGGILDRFDSIIITAPIVFYYIKLIL